jgi:predicted nucleic acid-binding protein
LFLDTWGWLVLADSREPAHSQAVSERRSRGLGSLVTTDYVLDETFTRLFTRCSFAVAREFSKAIMEAASGSSSGSGGLLRIERITPERFEAAYRMRLRYRDKPGISFTDFTSFVVMKDLGITDVLTVDAHFAQVRLGFRCLP